MADQSPWWMAPAMVGWCQVLLNSYHRWANRDLVERAGSPEAQAHRLFTAPFVVVSHGIETDPILNYGNRAALDLWEASWEQFRTIPSRLTAEPGNRLERERMLALASERGFIEDYRGVRISRNGRRFLVEHALVWNVIDGRHIRLGQAATFSYWTFLQP
ncbi:MAG: MEKHLA domain-containing protein [Nitrospiraceae bacterium]|nr:MEKHLA domain-containing protein [Nitrospiraceae bacterium]